MPTPTASSDPKVFAGRMKERMDQGFTFLKMDLGIRPAPGRFPAPSRARWARHDGEVSMTEHMFTGIEIHRQGHRR